MKHHTLLDIVLDGVHILASDYNHELHPHMWIHSYRYCSTHVGKGTYHKANSDVEGAYFVRQRWSNSCIWCQKIHNPKFIWLYLLYGFKLRWFSSSLSSPIHLQPISLLAQCIWNPYSGFWRPLFGKFSNLSCLQQGHGLLLAFTRSMHTLQ